MLSDYWRREGRGIFLSRFSKYIWKLITFPLPAHTPPLLLLTHAATTCQLETRKVKLHQNTQVSYKVTPGITFN